MSAATAFILGYFIVLNLFYLALTALAWREVARHLHARAYVDEQDALSSPLTPPVTWNSSAVSIGAHASGAIATASCSWPNRSVGRRHRRRFDSFRRSADGGSVGWRRPSGGTAG